MMDHTTLWVGIGAMLTGLVVARFIDESAMRKLTDEERGRLLGAFSRMRLFALIPLVAALALFAAAQASDLRLGAAGWLGYLAVVFAWTLVQSGIVLRRVGRIGLPATYVRSQRLSTIVRIGGFAAFFVLVALWLIQAS